jgi:23S rRNA (cytidine1920-2'-O)/16S rRNA (cytidine1409-2'-O)-methyltransferase
VRRGLAGSREAARALVGRGAVLVGGTVADKPARLVAASEPVVVDDHGPRFVSRGGRKLEAALDRFGIDVAGRRCLDAGASTGGFTDCLLQRGAAAVVAVDVGYGQLAPALRADPRVLVRERTNVRGLAPADVGGEGFDVVVADLSFISLTAVVPALLGPLARPGAEVVVLVKPQFEAGRAEVGRGRGVIRDPDVRRAALGKVASACASQGATIMGAMASPVLGPAGNAEFLLHVRAHGAPAGAPSPRSGAPGADAAIDAAVHRALDAAVSEAPDAAPRPDTTGDR